MKGTPLASFQAETLDRVWWREWAFLGGHCPCPRLPRSPSGWAGSSGALVCGPPAQQGVGSTPGSGTLSSAKRAHCLGTPLGPFEVAAHAPFPSLPCLPNRSGVSRLFTFHKSLGLIAPRRLLGGIPRHWMLSPAPPPRSLAVLASISHAPPKLLLALLASFPYSSPRPPHPLKGFELPGAQGSGQRPEGPASGRAALAIWGFSHVDPEARTSPGNPPA